MRNPAVVAAWRKRMQRWEKSGSDVKAFCRTEGVSKQSFYAWRRKLEELEDHAPPVEFVQVAGPAPIEVEVGDAVVRLRAGFDQDALAALLDVLERRL